MQFVGVELKTDQHAALQFSKPRPRGLISDWAGEALKIPKRDLCERFWNRLRVVGTQTMVTLAPGRSEEFCLRSNRMQTTARCHGVDGIGGPFPVLLTLIRELRKSVPIFILSRQLSR